MEYKYKYGVDLNNDQRREEMPGNTVTGAMSLPNISEPVNIPPVQQILPDGVWFRVFSFLHRHHDPTVHSLGIVDNDPLAVGDLFRLMASVSKNDNRRLFRYLKFVPMDFTYSYYELATFAWACKHRMKLGGVVSFTSIGRIALNLYMHMIRSCNIYDMHTLTLNLHHVSSHVSRHFRRSAMENNIPEEVLKVPMSPMEFQTQYADYLRKHSGINRTPSLKKLHLRIRKDEFHAPFLTSFSQSLEELSLNILKEERNVTENENENENENGANDATASVTVSTKRGSYDDDLEQMSAAIQKLPKLKKLTICANMQAVFRIRSKSLEEINTKPSSIGFWVNECICPSLKLFRSRYHFPIRRGYGQDPGVPYGNGLTPVFTCYRDDVKDKFRNEKRLNELEVHAGSHPFVGMQVPSSCVVLMTNHDF